MRRKVFLVLIMMVGVINFSSISSGNLTNSSIMIIPQVVFIHPEGLVNGSSFIPRDYIYFTLSGNLQDWEADTYSYDWWIDYQWLSNESVLEARMENGVWLINPFFRGKFVWDCWHNLTLFFKVHGEYVHSEIYQFYADPSLIQSEPMSIIPINYPNNSIVPYLGYYSVNAPTFRVTGYRAVIESWHGIEKHFFKKQLNCSFRWNEEEWKEADPIFRRGSSYGEYEYVSYHMSIFGASPTQCTLIQDGKQHSLDIRITNGSHSKNSRYYYTMADYSDVSQALGYNWWIHCNPDEYSTTYGVGGADHLSPDKRIAFVNMEGNYTTLIYNWHDGNGNHTTTWNETISILERYDEPSLNVTGIIVSPPDFPPEETGVKYLSYWIEKDGIWSPELTYVYYYDRLIPEINLIYPKNDSVKTNRIPLIWSLDTFAKGFWDFSQYKFDLYYETPIHSPTLITSNYNPIIYQTKTKINTHQFWYLKDLVNYYRNCSDPMLLGYEFSIPLDLVENTNKIRFIIEETTTGFIPTISTEWLSISPEVVREESLTTEETTSTTEETLTTEMDSSSEIEESTTVMVSYPKESTSSTVNKSSWYFNLSIVFFVLVIFRKRRND